MDANGCQKSAMSGCIGYQNWEFWRTVGTFTRVLSRAVCAHKFWSILGILVPEAEIQTNEDGSVSSFRDRFLSGGAGLMHVPQSTLSSLLTLYKSTTRALGF